MTGTKWNILAAIVNQIIGVGSFILLGRILTPSDFGLFGMVAVVIGFSRLFIDLGLSKAFIQKKNTVEDDVSSVFWANILLGFLITVVVFCLSGPIAGFYGYEELQLILQVSSITFLLTSLGITNNALATKEMNFATIANSNMLAKIISSVTAVLLALNGWGVWALIAYQIVMSCSYSFLIVYNQGWLPKFRFSFQRIKSMLSFSTNYSLVSIYAYFARKSDEVLLGTYTTAADLGIYSQSYRLMLAPLNLIKTQLVNVLFPVFSTIQEDHEKLRSISVKLTRILAFIGLPILGYIWLGAPRLVPLVLGDEWLEMIPVIQILIFYALFEITIFPGAIMLATGQSKGYLNLMVAGRTLFFLCIFGGVKIYGLEGLLFGAVLSSALNFLPYVYFSGKRIGLRIIDVLKACAPSFLITLSSVIIVLVIKNWVNLSPDFVFFLLESVAFASAYIGLSMIFNTTMCTNFFTRIKNELNVR